MKKPEMMKHFRIYALAGIVLAGVFFNSCERSEYEFARLYEDLPFDMPRVERPSIPDFSVSLIDFGAIPDGSTLNTDAFASAIASLEEKGGGHLNIPAGLWFTGPVSLKSNIDLHLEKGAIIIFSDDPELYPVVDINFEGLDTRRCISLISGFDLKNISITGEGTIEGNGDYWRMLRKSMTDSHIWQTRIESGRGVVSEDGECWYPDEEFKRIKTDKSTEFNVPKIPIDENTAKRFLRPVLVGLQNCENVLLEGCTFQNSPSWNLHPVFCRNLIVKDVTVRSAYYSQNGDGIDIDACTNTILTNSTFDVGDDAICIKSGKNEDGRRHGIPTENLIVDGCTVYHGHGGFVVGSEMSGGVKSVKVSNCCFLGTDVGLRFKSCRGRGGVVENIHCSNILMRDIVTDAVTFNLFYTGKSAVEEKAGAESAIKIIPEADETTPEFRNIHINNITCAGAGSAMLFNGLPEMPVSGIEISDCVFSSENGMAFRRSKDIKLKNVKVNSHNDRLVLENTENFIEE